MSLFLLPTSSLIACFADEAARASDNQATAFACQDDINGSNADVEYYFNQADYARDATLNIAEILAARGVECCDQPALSVAQWQVIMRKREAVLYAQAA